MGYHMEPFFSLLLLVLADIDDPVRPSFFTTISFDLIADNYASVIYLPMYKTIGANRLDIDIISIGKWIGGLFPSNL